ncbi:PREDICTED: protein BREAST CANCER SUSCEPTIBILITY 2 homolog B [Tarenaya hassleriana]|uniref:protein BREAST CANCER SUSCEPTIBILITY 2 homolog B n=1 Tax=Tarenaya hassleriana TaxID=28532 RepID=UPI00053C480B|nr:PREDICTED: protein BREAST CANCER SUSCEPTIBILITY 2 homolog B [Tarenaya hassleriana]
MSTWQIVSGAGIDGFRWEVGGRIILSDSDSSLSAAPLPSMSDLLLQGCSELLDPEEAVSGELPMFRTGSGKSVALKESSIARAMSFLADDKFANSGAAIAPYRVLQAPREALPLFRTASGKSVPLKESSITKALSVLGDDNMALSDTVLAGESRLGFTNSFFQTGSGKKVGVSCAGFARAKVLLGLEEDNMNGFNHVKDLSSSRKQHRLVGLETRKQSDAASVLSHSGTLKLYEGDLSRKQPEVLNTSSMVPPIKFRTAGGKSLSVSSEALKRARNLLGDPELGNFLEDVAVDDKFFTPQNDQRSDDITINNGSGSSGYFNHQGKSSNKHTSISPPQSSSKQLRSLVNPGNLTTGSNLIKKFDAAASEKDCALNVTGPAMQELLRNKLSVSDFSVKNSKEIIFSSRIKQFGRPADRALADITNSSSTAYADNKQASKGQSGAQSVPVERGSGEGSHHNKQASNEKKRLGRTASVSPFKRPRSSIFHTPLRKNVQHAPSGLSVVSSDNPCSKRVISTRYPHRIQRVSMKEYFGMHPSTEAKLDHLPDQVRRITSSNADNYVFCDTCGPNMIGVESFLQMLAESGASLQHASREWVTNHYRWVVWKLACYEKYYPAKCAGKVLTIPNVFEELKYRYEREINHGQCSAIKRILAGDAPASSMMVLCISAIHPKSNDGSWETNSSDNSNNVKVELTDGWYAMDAALDVWLTKQLHAGKLFVGQKLRIWGAGLCGWVGPTSPLETVNKNMIYLLLNTNGTHRAHWGDRLGFCKGVGSPLSFSCIKSNGGLVPRTLAGITRIYPMLYKERLSTGKSIVRSERTESKMVQLHNQRRSALVEGLISEFQRGICGFHSQNESDSEEGAKNFRLLENAAEPEVLMAEMSPEQLTSFTVYKAKLEAARQKELNKSIEKALVDAGLGVRDVTPFMRVRVVGLTSRNCSGKHKPKEGIVTIWNPTEKQKTELTEGHIYSIKGLTPMNSDSETLYLQARGPSTRWQPLSPEASRTFQPFLNPRESACLSNLGKIPLSSEFDIVAYIVYVGEAVKQKKQWVFVADGSCPHSQSEEISNSLLAISFSSPDMGDVSLPHINYNLVGSTVGFCNLIKRPKDNMNNLWVAEATENSIYFMNFDSPSHLRTARDNVQRWAKFSTSVIEKLQQRVLFIISG